MPLPQSEDIPSKPDSPRDASTNIDEVFTISDAVAARQADADFGLFGGTFEIVDDDSPPPPAGKIPPPGVFDPDFFRFPDADDL